MYNSLASKISLSIKSNIRAYEYFPGAFATLALQRSIDEILDHGPLTPRDVQFWDQGDLLAFEKYCRQDSIDPELARNILRSGIGCRIMDYGRFDDGLNEVQADLQSQTRDQVTLNLYLTHRNRFMLKVHSDLNSSCILQLEGQKQWYVFSEQNEHTLEPVEIVLSPGDILFINRNICHKAIALTEKSLHLTFGFQSKELAYFTRSR